MFLVPACDRVFCPKPIKTFIYYFIAERNTYEMETSPFVDSMLTVERPSQVLFKKVKEPMDTKKDMDVKLSQMLPNDSKESVQMKVDKDRSTPRHLQDQTNTPMPLGVPKLKKKMSHQNGKLKFTVQKELSSHSNTSKSIVRGKMKSSSLESCSDISTNFTD